MLGKRTMFLQLRTRQLISRVWTLLTCSRPSATPGSRSAMSMSPKARLCSRWARGFDGLHEHPSLCDIGVLITLYLWRCTTQWARWPRPSTRRCSCGWSPASTSSWTPSSPGSTSSGSWTSLALRSLMWVGNWQIQITDHLMNLPRALNLRKIDFIKNTNYNSFWNMSLKRHE